jgi:hypothetical protein
VLITKVIKIILAIIGRARREGLGWVANLNQVTETKRWLMDPQNYYLSEIQNLFSALNRFYITELNKRKFNKWLIF